jgi:hypothetical protein
MQLVQSQSSASVSREPDSESNFHRARSFLKEDAPSFENSGRRGFSKYDGLRLGTGASASKSGEFGYALLLYQCYSHLVEWLVVAE